MKNKERWKPSKYVYRKGRLMASRDRAEIGVASRLIADLVAGVYGEHIPRHAKGRLLDLGCGKVPLYLAYRDYVTDNVCVDWANTRHPNEYLDYEGDITQALPFGDEAFDTIIASDVLEHIPEPEQLWREMYRVLAVNGKVLVNVPFFYWLHERPHDYYRYTEFALRRFVERAGLKLVQLDAIGGSPEVMADMVAKHVQFFPLIGSGIAIFVQYLTSLFVRTGLGGQVSRRTGQGFPLGYFLIAEKVGAAQAGMERGIPAFLDAQKAE